MALEKISQAADGWIDAAELVIIEQELSLLIEDHPEMIPQALQILRDAAIVVADTSDEVRTWLDSLIEEYTTPEVQDLWSYSTEALSNSMENENSRNLLRLYDRLIAQDLVDLYGNSFETLTNTGKETVKLVLWQAVQSKMSVRWVFNTGASSITSMFSEFTGIFSWTDASNASQWVLKRELDENLEELKQIPGISADVIKEIEATIGILSSVIWWEADKLWRLFEISSNIDREEKSKIFENPQILSAILKDGTYTDSDGYNIDLEKWIIEVWTAQDLTTIQAEFMVEIQWWTAWLWNAIERMQWMWERFPFLKDLIMNFSETSFIGIFIKAIFWWLFDRFNGVVDTVDFQSALRGIEDRAQRNSINKLTSFLWDYAQEENTDNPALLNLATIWLSDNFILNSTDFFETLKASDVDFSAKDFWKNILTWESGTSQEQEIYSQIRSILESSNLNEDVFTQALNWVSISLVIDEEHEDITDWAEDTAASATLPTDEPLETEPPLAPEDPIIPIHITGNPQ